MADTSERFYPSDLPASGGPNLERGVTVRDWYAGQVLCAMFTRFHYEPGEYAEVAANAMAAANALIAARDTDNVS